MNSELAPLTRDVRCSKLNEEIINDNKLSVEHTRKNNLDRS